MSPTDQSTTIATLRTLMADFIAERHWHKYHTPKNLSMALTAEAGELLELFQWLTPEEAADRIHNDPEFRRAVGEELADILLFLLSLANTLDLDLATTVHAKMAKNKKKYPADQYQGHYQRPLPK